MSTKKVAIYTRVGTRNQHRVQQRELLQYLTRQDELDTRIIVTRVSGRLKTALNFKDSRIIAGGECPCRESI